MTAPRNIDLEILSRRLAGIADEVATALVRTSFSMIARDAHDYSCAICDAEGRMLMQASHGNPSHVGALYTTLKNILKDYHPADTLKPGDVLVTNDPWIGNGHLPDVFVITPAFRKDRVVAFVVSIVHHMDFGGRLSTPKAREIYEEGLRLPPQKLLKQGEENAELFEMIRWNVRVADKVIGDLRAQVTATHVGAKRIEGMLEEKGWDDLDALGEELLNRTEAAMRDAIRDVPDGHYEYEMLVDQHRGEDIIIRMGIDVAGDEMHIDYTGTTDRIDRVINVVFNYTNAHTIYAVKCALARDLPSNEGCIRPIKVTAPLGSIVNAEFPISVNQRSQIGHLLPELVFQALAPVIPDQVIAGSGSTPLWSHLISGSFADKRPFLVYFGMQGGLGARGHTDGVTCLSFPANVANTPVEVLEQEAALICEEKALATDSGGPGRYRGGLGQDFTIRMRDGDAAPNGRVTATLRGGRYEHDIPGIVGG
jgi:N-methylhydantoinase B/oxoprolinase/acetone carboxylase alpha subunit